MRIGRRGFFGSILGALGLAVAPVVAKVAPTTKPVAGCLTCDFAISREMQLKEMHGEL